MSDAAKLKAEYALSNLLVFDDEKAYSFTYPPNEIIPNYLR